MMRVHERIYDFATRGLPVGDAIGFVATDSGGSWKVLFSPSGRIRKLVAPDATVYDAISDRDDKQVIATRNVDSRTRKRVCISAPPDTIDVLVFVPGENAEPGFFDIFMQERPHVFSLDDITVVDERELERLRTESDDLFAAYLQRSQHVLVDDVVAKQREFELWT